MQSVVWRGRSGGSGGGRLHTKTFIIHVCVHVTGMQRCQALVSCLVRNNNNIQYKQSKTKMVVCSCGAEGGIRPLVFVNFVHQRAKIGFQAADDSTEPWYLLLFFIYQLLATSVPALMSHYLPSLALQELNLMCVVKRCSTVYTYCTVLYVVQVPPQ